MVKLKLAISIAVVIVIKYRVYLFVTDLINRIVQVLKRDLYWVKISTREAGLIEPVKL